MSVDKSYSGVDKVLAPTGSQGGQVKAGPCSRAVVVTELKPAKGIKKETYQSIGEAGIGSGRWNKGK